VERIKAPDTVFKVLKERVKAEYEGHLQRSKNYQIEEEIKLTKKAKLNRAYEFYDKARTLPILVHPGQLNTWSSQAEKLVADYKADIEELSDLGYLTFLPNLKWTTSDRLAGFELRNGSFYFNGTPASADQKIEAILIADKVQVVSTPNGTEVRVRWSNYYDAYPYSGTVDVSINLRTLMVAGSWNIYGRSQKLPGKIEGSNQTLSPIWNSVSAVK
jgi:hypothetical protein